MKQIGWGHKTYYLVKWKGYPTSDNSWEPKDSCRRDDKGVPEEELAIKQKQRKKAIKDGPRQYKRHLTFLLPSTPSKPSLLFLQNLTFYIMSSTGFTELVSGQETPTPLPSHLHLIILPSAPLCCNLPSIPHHPTMKGASSVPSTTTTHHHHMPQIHAHLDMSPMTQPAITFTLSMSTTVYSASGMDRTASSSPNTSSTAQTSPTSQE